VILRLIKIIVLLPIILSTFHSTAAQEIQFLTEDLPPLQIENDNQVPTGALVELINLIIKDADIDAKLNIYPWARSYELALHKPNTFIFSMLRSDEREDKFQWIGKLFTIKSYLATLQSNIDIKINNINDAKAYSVGSIRHDLAESYLLSKGFIAKKNLYVASKYPVLWNMLYSGRTEVVFTNSIVWRHEIEKAALDPTKIKFVYEIPDFASDLYLAASKSTEKSVIKKVKDSLEAIKADGRYDKIMTKWQLNHN
jgi:polar amino acid transport system substrate-binding protein